uniref:Uncharacterized protein n=1 Tax=uncultured marine virus TaxID=186617 RepID=A0A0F7L4B0_9VIRU|nr:hypothetical protein [uncultured marine virus]
MVVAGRLYLSGVETLSLLKSTTRQQIYIWTLSYLKWTGLWLTRHWRVTLVQRDI